MGFLPGIFGNNKKQLGKVAIHINSKLKEVRERWNEYCVVLLNNMGVEPIRSTFSENGVACVAAFQFFMFTHLVTEKEYIKDSQRDELFDLVANMLFFENKIVYETFCDNLNYFHEAPDASELIFRLSDGVAKDLVGEDAILGEAVALSSNVNLLIAMTKMITAESFRDFKTAKEFENILDTMFNSDT